MKTLINVVDGKVIVTDPNGNTRIHHYTNDITAEETASFLIGRSIRRMYKPTAIAKAYIDAGDILGVSVAAYVKMLIGAQHRAYVVPELEIHNRFDWDYRWEQYKPKGLDHYVTKRRWFRNAAIIELINRGMSGIKQYITDGNTHLAGFALITGDAYFSKKRLGKGLWRTLASNSKSRNDKICKVVLALRQLCFKGGNVIGLVKMLSGVKSTMLNKLSPDMFENVYRQQQMYGINNMLNKIVGYINKPMVHIETAEIDTLISEIVDCARMRENFNPNWGIKRIKAEHLQAIRDGFKKQYPDTPLPCATSLPNYIEKDEFSAELLTSPLQIATHGKEMHHCVASYIHDVETGYYAVYKISDGKHVTTTLGIGNGMLRTQHLGVCNSEVRDTDRVVFAKSIVRKITALLQTSITIPMDNEVQMCDFQNNIPF